MIQLLEGASKSGRLHCIRRVFGGYPVPSLKAGLLQIVVREKKKESVKQSVFSVRKRVPRLSNRTLVETATFGDQVIGSKNLYAVYSFVAISKLVIMSLIGSCF